MNLAVPIVVIGVRAQVVGATLAHDGHSVVLLNVPDADGRVGWREVRERESLVNSAFGIAPWIVLLTSHSGAREVARIAGKRRTRVAAVQVGSPRGRDADDLRRACDLVTTIEDLPPHPGRPALVEDVEDTAAAACSLLARFLASPDESLSPLSATAEVATAEGGGRLDRVLSSRRWAPWCLSHASTVVAAIDGPSSSADRAMALRALQHAAPTAAVFSVSGLPGRVPRLTAAAFDFSLSRAGRWS
ncbi:MAG: hypothetical protein ACOZNI_27090 [Myxococcota bacterium]